MKKQIVFALLLALQCTWNISSAQDNNSSTSIVIQSLVSDEIDTITTEKSSFTFSRKVNEPTPFAAVVLDKGQQNVTKVFYIDKETAQIILTDNKAGIKKVTGGKTQKEYSKYEAEILPILNQFTSAKTSVASGEISQAVFQQKIRAIATQYELVAQNFIASNPSSYVSPLIAYESFRQSPSKSNALKKKLYNGFDKNIQASHFGKKIKEIIDHDEKSSVGNNAPDFKFNTPNDELVSLSSLRGKYVLVDFWASWCRPCRQDNKHLVEVYKLYKDKNFTILGVSLDKLKGNWSKAIKADNLSWTQVSDLKGWNSEIVNIYGLKSIPANVLIDPSGKIIAKNLRNEDLDNKLKEILR